MAEFSGMLEHRKDELYGDVFDLLMTLSSFDAFKELMLAYKAEAEAEAKARLHHTPHSHSVLVHIHISRWYRSLSLVCFTQPLTTDV